MTDDLMRDWIFSHWEHVLCALLLLSRIADLGTTWLVTPKLRLEANPIVQKLRWPFAVVTLLACLLPYYHTGLAYSALVLFLLVSASNAKSIWLARTLGEDRYLALLREAASRSTAFHAVSWTLLTSALYALFAGLLWLLSQDTQDWARWAALGVWMYAFVHGFYGSLFLVRLIRKTAAAEVPAHRPASP